jgi:hypothetical protein
MRRNAWRQVGRCPPTRARAFNHYSDRRVDECDLSVALSGLISAPFNQPGPVPDCVWHGSMGPHARSSRLTRSGAHNSSRSMRSTHRPAPASKFSTPTVCSGRHSAHPDPGDSSGRANPASRRMACRSAHSVAAYLAHRTAAEVAARAVIHREPIRQTCDNGTPSKRIAAPRQLLGLRQTADQQKDIHLLVSLVGGGREGGREGFSAPRRSASKTAAKSAFSGQPRQVVCSGSMYRNRCLSSSGFRRNRRH